MSDEIKVHPIQYHNNQLGMQATVPQVVSLRSYEVYSEVYGVQEALVTGGCRGGFSVGELLAFLYAHSFPRNEWRARVDEAFRGMNLPW